MMIHNEEAGGGDRMLVAATMFMWSLKFLSESEMTQDNVPTYLHFFFTITHATSYYG